MSLTGFLFAFKIWIYETFPMASIYYIMTTRQPRTVRWDRSAIGIVTQNAYALLDVSTPERAPRERMVPTPWEASQEWFIQSHRWFRSTAGRRPSKRSRVTQAVDDDVGSESEGDDHPDHDMGHTSHAGVSRADEAISYQEPPLHTGHSPFFHHDYSPACHYQHSPHVDPYADRWSEFTRLKDDFFDYRTSHRTEHEDLERRLAEKWEAERAEHQALERLLAEKLQSEQAEREALERRLVEVERFSGQFRSMQIPAQQQGGQPSQPAYSQPADPQHGFGSSIFGGPSQYTDNSSASFVDDLFGPSSYVTPMAYTGLAGQSTGGSPFFSQGQYLHSGTFGSLLHWPGPTTGEQGFSGLVGALFQDTP
ncbi:hypothetical protein L6452_08270 [Arctium lappa]|uniref:Uncharacterized protein n=1 Tax=Arctium lappa TaxID=4217 RepID=A0ACB9DGU6_ARCLA|nr:hypothetical protein L6452_08270 [Arctium lappa]